MLKNILNHPDFANILLDYKSHIKSIWSIPWCWVISACIRYAWFFCHFSHL